jgi:hypothetical protein
MRATRRNLRPRPKVMEQLSKHHNKKNKIQKKYVSQKFKKKIVWEHDKICRLDPKLKNKIIGTPKQLIKT